MVALAWLLFALVMVAIEVVTTAFFAIFVAIGGLAAMAYAFTSDNVWIQMAVFAGVAIGGMAVARPMLVRRVHGGSPVPVFRGQDVAGQTGVVVDHVGDAHHAGHVRIGGEQWLAVTEDSGALPPGTEVVVADVQGTTLTVRPVPSASRPTSPTPAPAEG